MKNMATVLRDGVPLGDARSRLEWLLHAGVAIRIRPVEGRTGYGQLYALSEEWREETLNALDAIFRPPWWTCLTWAHDFLLVLLTRKRFGVLGRASSGWGWRFARTEDRPLGQMIPRDVVEKTELLRINMDRAIRVLALAIDSLGGLESEGRLLPERGMATLHPVTARVEGGAAGRLGEGSQAGPLPEPELDAQLAAGLLPEPEPVDEGPKARLLLPEPRLVDESPATKGEGPVAPIADGPAKTPTAATRATDEPAGCNDSPLDGGASPSDDVDPRGGAGAGPADEGRPEGSGVDLEVTAAEEVEQEPVVPPAEKRGPDEVPDSALVDDGHEGGGLPAPHQPVATSCESAAQVWSRRGRIWHISFNGKDVAVVDSKGMRNLAVLLARPHQSIGSAVLAAEAEIWPEATGVGPDDEQPLSAQGGIKMTDKRALAAVKRQISKYDKRLASEELDAMDRADLLQKKADLEKYIKGTSFRGKAKQDGSPNAKARSAVTRRIWRAEGAVSVVHPALGRHLDVYVKTGISCTYAPPVDAPRWTVKLD